MAELLIQWKGHTLAADGFTPTPELPKKGDIRDVGPNGNDWGLRCDKRLWILDGRDPARFPNDYAIVIVSGISVPNLMKLKRRGTRAAESGDLQFGAPDLADRFVRLHRYVWRLNISELTPVQRGTINTDRVVTIPKAKFIEVSEHKIKSVIFDENDPDGEGQIRLPGAG